MADRFSITVTGTAELQKLMEQITRRCDDLSPIFRGPIDKSVTMMERAQFSSKGAYGGLAWAPLRPSTKRARVRPGGNRGGIGHPLWDTGAGKASLEKVGPNSFRTIGPQFYERGSTLARMALHQVGYTINQWGGKKFKHSRRVPARPPIPDPIPEFVSDSWARIIENFLAAGKAT